MSFQFPALSRPPARPERAPGLGREPATEENLPTFIQGKPVDSKPEARVAISLEILGWGYIYKASYYGGRTTPGGVEVDFLVLLPIVYSPLSVKSTYYHGIVRSGAKDVFDAARLHGIPGLGPLKEIWDYQARSIEQTVRTLEAMYGRA